MKEVYQQTKQELFEMFGNAAGHTGENAKDLLKKYGENALEEKGRKSVFRVFLEQFADLLVIILIAAAVISMLSGNVESAIVIFAVIILNAILGTVQYVKAEQSLDSLKKLSAPKAKVLRDGIKKEVASKDVVPGDVLLLEAGDIIVADGRIIENYSLQVNENSLTGESTNVDKRDEEIGNEAALGDRYNMVFSGSLVTYGRANVLVTATGMNTEMGMIATLMNDTKDKKTPLQVSLDDFSKKLAVVIMVISAIVFGLRIWQQEPGLDSLIAGSLSVICSDKTGTLTQNKMTVKEVYIDGKCMLPEELDLTSSIHRYFLYIAILNNDSTISAGKEIGDPTETCLLNMARKSGIMEAGVTEEDIRSMMPRIEEIPFDSDRKLMSTKYRVHGVPTVLTKGAVDVLLDRTKAIATSKGIREITEADKERIIKQNQAFSENGLRVLAFAYKECEEYDVLSIDNEYGYTFIGLVSMIDPPREESIEAVADAVRAGIKPVMITGDHKVTATAIAKQIGIYQDGDMSVTGQELDKMPDERLEQILGNISVYARVSPENKIRIVDAWQRKGEIVAMTGDGVNDAPALKKADIGVAMGITGTEVSKDASAMILADDNFATIIKAVLNGRNVYRNILNAIQFLLSGNMAAILVVLFCSFMALGQP